METLTKTKVKVSTTIKASQKKIWDYWNDPTHIKQWCQASPDWHVPHAENDITTGGKFKTTMAAKDGSFGFDFEGEYTRVEPEKTIHYTLTDGRKVEINFIKEGNDITVEETFEAESQNSTEMQRAGWQAILDSFKNYVEKN